MYAPHTVFVCLLVLLSSLLTVAASVAPMRWLEEKDLKPLKLFCNRTGGCTSCDQTEITLHFCKETGFRETFSCMQADTYDSELSIEAAVPPFEGVQPMKRRCHVKEQASGTLSLLLFEILSLSIAAVALPFVFWRKQRRGF